MNLSKLIKFPIRMLLLLYVMLLSPFIVVLYWVLNDISLKESITNFKLEVKGEVNRLFKR